MVVVVVINLIITFASSDVGTISIDSDVRIIVEGC